MRQYSKEVEKLIITEPKNRLIENVLGLGEEAGDVQGKVKKHLELGNLYLEKNFIKVNQEHKYFTNEIASDFFKI